MTMHLFDKDISSERAEKCRYKSSISENWSINNVPDGGYLMAILAWAMLNESKKKSTPIITANYVSRCSPGGAEILIGEIADSNQFQRFEARLLQEGKEKIRAMGTFVENKVDCVVER
jgi:hypothetical protein